MCQSKNCAVIYTFTNKVSVHEAISSILVGKLSIFIMDNQNHQETNAAADQLRDYIKQQLHTGLNPNEIRTQLQQAGWQDNLINSAFLLVQNDVVPNTEQSPEMQNQAIDTQQPTQQEAETPIVQLGETNSQPQPAATITRGRFRTGWLLFKQSLRLLKNNKKLTRYMFMSFLVGLILTIVYAVIFIVGKHVLLQTSTTSRSSYSSLKPAGYVVAFLYYILAYFVINIYSAGLVANVIDLFHGQSHDYTHYMKMAWSKSGTLFVFSFIEASIGLILRVIAERSKLLGRIIALIIGALWSLARLFVIPVIVTSDDNAFKSIRRSTKLLISTWGENLVGRVSFGAVTIILFIVVLIPISLVFIFLASLIGHVIGGLISIAFIALLFMAFSILMTTASNVLNTALFYFAQYRQIPAAFDAELINSVFISRKRKGLFGLGGKTT